MRSDVHQLPRAPLGKLHLLAPGIWTSLWLALSMAVTLSVSGCSSSQPAGSKVWQKEMLSLRWVAYSPSGEDPNSGLRASVESIRKDLATLRKAGFSGIVTYSTKGALGTELPAIAKSAGFGGLIMGLWELADAEEFSAARAASGNPLVLGYCIGNEGFPKRYNLKQLSIAVDKLRQLTGKPVATTEEFDDYADEELLAIGDWIFPNAHPLFHGILEPGPAVRWTEHAYQDLLRRTNRFVMFKEVGLPTAGDAEGKLSEESQMRYYLDLARTQVRFVYFEAFDLPWKNQLPVESHWGIFKADRSPKSLGLRLMGKEPTTVSADTSRDVFWVYENAESTQNHFTPTGYMGDIGDLKLNEACENNPHSGKTCIQVTYEAKGKPPHKCQGGSPCKYAGVYWLEPANNWGTEAIFKDKGFDLSGFSHLAFWARADSSCKIEFKVGGISQPFGDTLAIPRTKIASLGKDWRRFEIDLKGADIKRLISGFCWTSSWEANPQGVTFYLDDICFEK